MKTIPIRIPAGVQKADFLLSWEDDWGHYPTSDIDMSIIDPNGNVFVDDRGSQPGATLAGSGTRNSGKSHSGHLAGGR